MYPPIFQFYVINPKGGVPELNPYISILRTPPEFNPDISILQNKSKGGGT